jgi:hypothetical protein
VRHFAGHSFLHNIMWAYTMSEVNVGVWGAGLYSGDFAMDWGIIAKAVATGASTFPLEAKLC